MIASLYQSASSCAADGAGTTASSGTVRFGISVTLAIIVVAGKVARPQKGRATASRSTTLSGSRLQAEYVTLPHAGVEPHVIRLTPPRVLHVVQKVVCDVASIRSGLDGAKPVRRRLHPSVLHVMRIEVDHDEHAARAVGRRFAVRDDLRIVGCLKPQRPVVVQGALAVADLVDAGDQFLDVSRPI